MYGSKLNSLNKSIANATTYDEFTKFSLAYDKAAGNDKYKHNDESADYDYVLIRKRLERIKQARLGNDANQLKSILHEGLHGNLGNIANPSLYQHTRFGTKALINDFLNEVCTALELIYKATPADISFVDKLAFFENTSHAYGQSCLMLSGGAGLGFFHCGVVKALLNANLLPNVISGASAGAIITAMIGTRSNEELKTLLSAETIYHYFKKWGEFKGINEASLLDSTNLENALIELFDLTTFEEAWLKTGRDINITVSPADLHQHSRMLNNKTSPNAIITQAVRASCAIPYLFEPIGLKAKNAKGDVVPYVPNRKFADGSIMADMPIDRLSRLYSVNHSIVSQTNPLAVPFLSRSREKKTGLLSMTTRHIAKLAKETSIFAFDVVEQAMPSQTGKLGIHKAKSIIEQQYVGDINILPPRDITNLRHILSNPTVASINSLIDSAERATWPQLEMINNTTKISRTFQHYLHLLRIEETQRLMG
ncbi:MAG: TAG lipase/steryl ester hydrolase/phospholipase A2/LPA acyltransferase [Phenylobacterium sp.]|jgi:TAG lipase/steryl ester hydrolase/phospholipase A2/LPA acyltransferase